MKEVEISVGDIIYMSRFEELIEILQCFKSTPNKGAQVAYYSDRYPNDVGTENCRVADAWIIFDYGTKVGSTK